MKNRYITYIAVFLAILWLPAAQHGLRLFPKASLHGVEAGPSSPRFTLAGWFDGTYAVNHEAYYNEHIGFRGYLVRTYNQVYYTVFRKINGRRGTQIVRGQDNWLYERDYVQHYLERGKMDVAAMETRIEQLRRLQDALDKRGIGLVLLISPSKPEIYPEHLPAEMLARPRRPLGESDYGRMVPMLERHGIRYVDGHALFLAQKPASAYPLFSPGGTHWNHYGAWLAVSETLRSLAISTGKPMPIPECASVSLRRPAGADRDLGDLINVWRYPGAAVPVPYPEYAIPAARDVKRPAMLFVGDSFTFTMLDVVRGAKVCGRSHFLYYFRRLFAYAPDNPKSDHGQTPSRSITEEDLNWEGVMLNKDIVVIETNENMISQLGFGFIPAALRHLEAAGSPAPSARKNSKADSGLAEMSPQ